MTTTRIPETEAGKTMRRFWAKVRVADNGCWEWIGAKISTGYGNFWSHERVNVLAHRFAYTVMVGPIPAGLHIDHLCRNPPCVNPSHLEVVTNRENTVRGDRPRMTRLAHSARAYCVRGHLLDEVNTVFYIKDGYRCRACRICKVERVRAWRRRQKGEAA